MTNWTLPTEKYWHWMFHCLHWRLRCWRLVLSIYTHHNPHMQPGSIVTPDSLCFRIVGNGLVIHSPTGRMSQLLRWGTRLKGALFFSAEESQSRTLNRGNPSFHIPANKDKMLKSLHKKGNLWLHTTLHTRVYLVTNDSVHYSCFNFSLISTTWFPVPSRKENILWTGHLQLTPLLLSSVPLSFKKIWYYLRMACSGLR
jgi:hypothetical protein